MKRRIAVISEIIAPYRIPVFNALAARDDIDLHVIFLSETDPSLRQWQIYKNEIGFSYEVLPSWRRRAGKYNLLLNRGLVVALNRFHSQAVLCGGYNYVASWQAARWSTRHKIPLLLWSESTAHDLRRRWLVVEWIKFRFTRRCTAFVAAGKSSRDYLMALGASDQRMFTAPNAVDVKFYAARAAEARPLAAEIRDRYGLPERYFLYSGRLIPVKGVFDLLGAYAKLEQHERAQIGLVFAGDGVSRRELTARAAEIQPGCIRFTGFVQREQLAELYALAIALVFPTHSDPWGLVVNEAMACGLPVIATDVAGCVPDLVVNEVNGFIVRPGNAAELVSAMRKLSESEIVAEMGLCAASRIQSFTPEACAEGIANAVQFACDGAKFV